MKISKRNALKSVLVPLVAALLSTSQSMVSAQTGPTTITVATIGEPPTLDPMLSTADLVGTITQHIFETLYTFGDEWKIVPLLASSMPTISKDGKTMTIPLRKGVKFHDGSVMTSEDVIASLNRWMKTAVRGKQAAAEIESISAVDASTVQFKLKNYYAPLLSLLAFNNSAAIVIPAKNTEGTLSKFIGTGPFQFKERQPDRYIVLSKFPAYTSRTENSNWYGGKRNANVDEIKFVPVPNANTRAEGAIGGQFSFTDAIPVESFARFAGNSKVEAILTKPFGAPIMFFNTKQGSVADAGIRRAIQMSLNTADMLEAAFGNNQFYAVDGSFYPQGFPFHSKSGLEAYNQNSPEKAKELAKKSGYTGRVVRILASSQYDFHLKMAQVAVQNMRMAGFTVDLQISDWATLTTRRNDPTAWEIYFTHSPFLPEPALSSIMNNNAPGWWATETKNKIADQLNEEHDFEKRKKAFGDFQKLMYEEVPIIKVGNFNVASAKSTNLIGYKPSPWPFFWNVSLKNN
jgi:peptide/nickel transport system substrate-binding protein